MADVADLELVEEGWDLFTVICGDEVVPITDVNSAASIKPSSAVTESPAAQRRHDPSIPQRSAPKTLQNVAAANPRTESQELAIGANDNHTSRPVEPKKKALSSLRTPKTPSRPTGFEPATSGSTVRYSPAPEPHLSQSVTRTYPLLRSFRRIEALQNALQLRHGY